MAQACISYKSLKDSSSEANDVAKKLKQYADNLESQVYKKLNNYSNTCSSNVSQAKTNIKAKQEELLTKAEKYRIYAEDLRQLRKRCEDTDKAVRSKVSKLTSEFKNVNGIKDSKIQNGINYILTSLDNASSAGRWIGNKQDENDSVKEYINQRLEDWWDYEGGKELVKGLALSLVEGVLAVCAIISAAAAIAGGAWIVGLASLVAGVIALSNAVADGLNEVQAYATTKNGDPATGQRRSEVNTWQDYLRSSFYYGDSGENYEYNSTLYAVASGIDLVNFVCSVINFLDGVGKLLKNVYKWTTGSMANIKDIRVKNILTKENFSAFKSKLGNIVKNGWEDIKKAVKSIDFKKIKEGRFDLSNLKIKEFVFDFADDFMNNLKKGYTFEIFSSDKKLNLTSIKHGSDLVKNYASIAKIFIKDGINLKTIGFTIGLKKLIIPNIKVGEVVTYSNKNSNRGVLSYDFNYIKLTDISGKYKGIISIWSDGKKIFKTLNYGSSISINIPDIAMPNLTGINDIRYDFV